MYDDGMPVKEKDNTISVSSGTIIKTIAIILGFVVLYLLRDLLLVILTAVVLASSIEPAVKFLARIRIPRIPAVLGVYVALAGLFAGLFYAFVPTLVNELVDFSEKLPNVAEELNLGVLGDSSSTLEKGKVLASNITDGNASPEQILAALRNFSDTSRNVTRAVEGFFGGMFSFILIVVLSFYFAMQKNGIEDFLRIVVPFSNEEYAIDLWSRSKEKIGKWMQGQLLLGVLIFVLVYLGLGLFQVPYALTLALLAGVLEIIPVFGPIIAAIPAVLVAFATGGISLAFVVVAIYVLVQQFESQLIYPLVVRKVVGVPPIIVILALIIGGQLGGFLGILISVPVAASLMEVVDDIATRKKRFTA